jgi:Fur family transcriptional regulator, ferric uptake regulator
MKTVSSPEAIKERLRKVGLKVTQPRLALLQVLHDGHGPFSPEDLHRRLDSELCDLVTVYRCLSIFEGRGLVRRCVFGDGRMRYELEQTHHHHHLICRHCGQVESLSQCVIKNMEAQLAVSGYSDISHSLEFFGTCPNCLSS